MLPRWSCCRRMAVPGSAAPRSGFCPNQYQHTARTSIVADVRADSALYLRQRSSLREYLAGRLLRRAARAAGWKARIQDGAPPGWAGTDVRTALLKPLQ